MLVDTVVCVGWVFVWEETEVPGRNPSVQLSDHMTIKMLNMFLPYSYPIFSTNQIAVCFENLNFYFIKTANIPVYGNIELSVYKIDCTRRCLEFICSVFSRHGLFVLAPRAS